MLDLGVPHGHTGHVRFLTCVEIGGAEGGSVPGTPGSRVEGSIPGTPGSRTEERVNRETSIPEDSASPIPTKFFLPKDKPKSMIFIHSYNYKYVHLIPRPLSLLTSIH